MSNRSDPIWRKIASGLIDWARHAAGFCPDCVDGQECDGGTAEELKSGSFQMQGDSVMVNDFGTVEAAKHGGKSVQLNKPHRISKGQPGYGRKMYVVYVGTGKGKVKKIMFGDPKLGQRPSNPAARKSFRARHKCHLKNDKTTPGYWACRYPPNW